MRRVAWAALAVVLLPACERGCAARRVIEEHLQGTPPGPRGEGPQGSPRTGQFGDLLGTDCSDGLARCVSGRVEVSRAAHLPHPCAPAASPEKPGGPCACPWDVVATCATGCAVDGLEVFAQPDVGTQLCQPPAIYARPARPEELADARVCAEGDGPSCRDGVVRVCDGAGLPARVAGVCVHGCEASVALDHGPTVPLDGALAILCVRPTAERK